MQRKGNKLLIQLCSAILLFLRVLVCFRNGMLYRKVGWGTYDMVINPKTFSIQSQMVTEPDELSYAVNDTNIKLNDKTVRLLGVNPILVVPLQYTFLIPPMSVCYRPILRIITARY